MTETSARDSLPIRLALAHPWRVILTWVVLIVASIAIIVTLLGDGLNNEQETTNNPESVQGSDLLDAHFDETVAVEEVLIVASSRHQVNSPEFQQFLGRLADEAEDVGVTVAG